ncbi:MAG: putative metal-binding motif-containing protein [Bacteroidetes bacterium]|nr:putative metal-binding motif-containing protein [Bacteroidota bacterium]
MFNASGVTLGGDQTIVDLLNFNYGRIITGSNKIIISSVGNIQNNANPPMYIDGNLQINFPAGGFGLTYHIGDASGYRPMQLSVSGNAGVGGFTVSTSNTEHPNLATSNIDPTKTVNRHWTITNNGSTFTTAFALFNWEAADVDGGANTGNFIGAKYDGASWTYPSIIGSSATSMVIRAHFFSSFAVGEAFPPPTIDVTGTFGPFCSDDAISIPFIATGTYNTGNIFTAYLSDANGSFASQTYLGELETEASGTINGTIPSAISGTGFRIKIVSSDPAVTSADNGSDIIISIPLDYYTDNDEDGYGAGPLIISSCVVQGGLAANADDCNDNDNSIYPGVTEICNAIDDDCNGLTDDGLTFVTYYEDLDTDGFGNPLVSQNTCDGPPAGVYSGPH